MSFANGGLVASISRAMSGKYAPKLVKWLGRKKPLTANQTQDIEATLNKLGPETVGKAQLLGTICTLPFVAMIGLIFGLPLMFPERTIFVAWDNLVLSMPNWVHIIAVLPIIVIAAICAMHLAIAIVRVFHRFKWPGQSTEYLYYMGEAVTHGPGGFKVQGDYIALSRIFLAGSLIIYAVVLGMYYLSTDLVTTTYYHKRSAIPFIGKTVAHEDLVYVYDTREKGTGDLNLFWAEDESLFLSRFMRGGSELQAQRMVDTIADIEAVQLFQTEGDSIPNAQDASDTFLADARSIISSDDNEIRLWTHPPRVLIISHDSRAARYLAEVRSALEQNVTSPFGETFFNEWEVFVLPRDWSDSPDQSQFEQVEGGPAGRQVAVKLGTAEPIHTDIVIVIADRSTLAQLNTLWGVNSARARRQAEGDKSGCFYASWDKDGVTRGAYVSIPSDLEADKLSSCIWEEVLHTLGPRQDASETDFFSFDDTLEVSESKKANDILLIRALYESGASAGDAPDQVLTYLDSVR